MADMGFKDFLIGKDLLVEHDMKPWWESFHGYLLGGSLAIGVLLTYMISPADTVHCLPTNADADSFSEPQAALTNGYCVSQVPWYAAYSGLICTALGTAILVCSNLWLSHPGVINGFRIFSKVECMFQGLQSPIETLKSAAVSPLTSHDEEQRILQKVRFLLWTYGTNVRKIYRIRNIAVISLTLLSVGITGFMIFSAKMLIEDPFINCSLTTIEDVEPVGGYRDFFCSYNVGHKVLPMLIFFLLTLLGQIVSLFGGIYMLAKGGKGDQEIFSEYFKASADYARFMKTFYKNSHPIDSDAFTELITFLFSKTTLNAMVIHIQSAATNSSGLDYINLFSKVHCTGGNVILSILFKMFQQNRKDNMHDVVEALSCFRFDKWDEHAKEFLDIAIKGAYWPLVVRIVNAAKDLPKDASRSVCLDFLESSNKCENSILYYALRKDQAFLPFNFNAIKYILASGKRDPSTKYVHYQGRSVTASEFIGIERHTNPTFSEELESQLFQVISNSELCWRKSNELCLCQMQFRDLYLRYTEIADEERSWPADDHEKAITGQGLKPPNYEKLEEIAHGISFLKFHLWNDEIRKFAKLATKMRHWKILVKLLNAKIVDFSEYKLGDKPEMENCGVTDFLLDTPLQHCDWYGRSFLFYIFIQNNGAHQPPFTAFRHLLACIWGRKLVVRELRRSKNLKEYIKNSRLVEHPYKDELCKLVVKCETNTSEPESSLRDDNVKWRRRAIH